MPPSGGFELRGKDTDETRLLIHGAAGYATAVPGHARTALLPPSPPKYDVLLQLDDLPVEIGFRIDENPTAIQPQALATTMALAYASDRAAKPPHVPPLPAKHVPKGAVAGAHSLYVRNGDDGRAMEHLVVVAKQVGDKVLCSFQTTRFRTGDVTPMQWANLRAALLVAPRWDGSEPSLPLWPSSEFAAPSAALRFTPQAWTEAQTKATEVGQLSDQDTDALVRELLEMVNNDEPPSAPVHPFVLEESARQIAQRIPSQAAQVLLRNIEQVKTFHDLRAWSWQCMWAVGNRSERSAGQFSSN